MDAERMVRIAKEATMAAADDADCPHVHAEAERANRVAALALREAGQYERSLYFWSAARFHRERARVRPRAA